VSFVETLLPNLEVKRKVLDRLAGKRLPYAMQERVHVSKSEAPLDMGLSYVQYDRFDPAAKGNTYLKWRGRPCGLWYGFEDNWEGLLRDKYEKNEKVNPAMYGGGRYAVSYRPGAKVCVVNSVPSLRKVVGRYPEIAWDKWDRLTKDYDGFELLNMRAFDRLAADNQFVQEHYDWLSRFEIDSGCCWNLGKITALEIPRTQAVTSDTFRPPSMF